VTTDALAAHCQAAPRGIRILADYLVVAGFLQKDGERYALTHDSAVFLDRRSVVYLGGAKDFLVAQSMVEAFLGAVAG
jgi:hypothetical protein